MEDTKPFKLRWATGKEARIHQEGEWQLRFRDGAARDSAAKRLNVNNWYPTNEPDEIIYIFHMRREISEPLANLIAAGIPKEEIELQ
jgi:hypothetical protein